MNILICIVMLLFACVKQNDTLMITSGLFAIAGSIDMYREPQTKTKDKQEN